MRRRRNPLARVAVCVGRFWWDFLVGETPELFVASLVVIAAVGLLARQVSSTAAWIVAPLLVALALGWSVARGRRLG